MPLTQLPELRLTDAWDTDPPALDFVLPGLLAGTVGLIIGQGGLGKSMLAMEAALSVAAGADIFHLFGQAPARGPVVVIAAEDPEPIIRIRLRSLRDQCREFEEEVREGFTLFPVYGHGVSFGVIEAGRPYLTPSGEWSMVETRLTQIRPRLVVIDTLNRLLGALSERDEGHMSMVLGMIERLCAVIGCAALLIHHTNKASANTGQADEQQAVRGSSALTDNCRWQTNLVPMTRDEATRRGMDDRTRRMWVRSVLAKVNYGAPREDLWLERKDGGMLLGGGEPPPLIARQQQGEKKPKQAHGSDIANAIPW